MVYLFISLLIVIIILAIVLLFFKVSNELSFIVAKLDKASKNVDTLLDEKYILMDKAYQIIKKKIKKKDYLQDFSELKKEKYTLSEYDVQLNKYLEIINGLKDDYKNLNTSEYKKILQDINIVDEKLIANENYSNKNSIILIKKLKGVYKVIAKLLKIKNYDVYDIKKPIND